MNDAITKNTEKKRRRLAIVFVGLSPITTCSVKSKQLHCSRPDSLNCLCQTQLIRCLRLNDVPAEKQAVLVRCTPVWYRERKAICFLKWTNSSWKGRFHN